MNTLQTCFAIGKYSLQCSQLLSIGSTQKNDRLQFCNSLFTDTLLGQLFIDIVQTDFIQFIDCYCNIYYTGAIFEVKALDVQIGSITGGGRYDNLTGVFGMAGVSGVGISFGADRIFDVLNQLELYPKEAVNGTQLLFINFGEKEAAFSMGILSKARAAGIRAEIFPDAAKMKKQMSYANVKNIPFVAIVGENEMNEGKAMLKNMENGEQQLVTAEELIGALTK